MYDFQQRNKIRKFVYSKIAVLILLIITIFLVRGAYSVLKKERESSKNVESVEQRLELAREKHDELDDSIDLLKTESGIEREIRNKFSVTKGEEEVAVIIDQEGQTEVSNTEKKGFWGKAVSWFGSLFD